MADIGKYGGIATVTASTTPAGHSISGYSVNSWLKVYQTGTTLFASASTNTNADNRTARLFVRVETTPDSSYNPSSTGETTHFDITQEGTGSTPPVEYQINVQTKTEGAYRCEYEIGINGDYETIYEDYGGNHSYPVTIVDTTTFTITIEILDCTFISGHSIPSVVYQYGTNPQVSMGGIAQEHTSYTFTSSPITYVSGNVLKISII